MENSIESSVKEVRQAIRQRFLAKLPDGGRYNLLAYAFIRGKTHEQLERRVSQHNLPHPQLLQVAVNWLLANEFANKNTWEQKATPEVTAWLKMPEERIKYYGPRVPKIRKSDRKANAAE